MKLNTQKVVGVYFGYPYLQFELKLLSAQCMQYRIGMIWYVNRAQ